jgi:hypothetical protein
MKNVGSEPRENYPRAQKRYVRPSCAILTADQVRMKLASAPVGDQQAQEWIHDRKYPEEGSGQRRQELGPGQHRRTVAIGTPAPVERPEGR